MEEYPEAWGLICEAEDHLRKHEFANIRREVEAAFLRGEFWPRRFVSQRPWEVCFILLSDPEHMYWTTRLRRPIDQWLARTQGRSGQPLTQAHKLMHTVAPGLVQIPQGSSV